MDIVERLRNQGEFWPNGLANEAADYIERLREALRKAQCGCEEPCLHGRYCSSWIAKTALKGVE